MWYFVHYIVCALFCISISFSSFVCIIKYMSRISCILCTNYMSHSSYGISCYIYVAFLIWHFLLYIYSTFLIWHFLLCLYSILHVQHFPIFHTINSTKNRVLKWVPGPFTCCYAFFTSSGLRKVRNSPICSSAFAIPKKTIESIGHIIKFLSARIGRIAINACPYSTCRHRVLRMTLQMSITTNFAASTLHMVSFFL